MTSELTPCRITTQAKAPAHSSGATQHYRALLQLLVVIRSRFERFLGNQVVHRGICIRVSEGLVNAILSVATYQTAPTLLHRSNPTAKQLRRHHVDHRLAKYTRVSCRGLAHPRLCNTDGALHTASSSAAVLSVARLCSVHCARARHRQYGCQLAFFVASVVTRF